MSITYINELDELKNILDDIIPEEDPLFFINEDPTIYNFFRPQNI